VVLSSLDQKWPSSIYFSIQSPFNTVIFLIAKLIALRIAKGYRLKVAFFLIDKIMLLYYIFRIVFS